ncbi:MAG: RNA polymerase sigma factor [Opitutus sp.]|nr:RNA polymerase sigma factor [Opitutus sp.]
MTRPSPPTDRFAAWMAEHGMIVEKVARVYARSEQERADLRRELMFQVWSSAARFDGRAQPSTWIYRVCLNTALTWRRNLGRQERRTERDSDLETLHHPSTGPAAAAERADLLERVYDAMARLSDLDRSLLLLHLDGLSYREAAEITGLSENHFGVALTRARQRLAAQLKEIIHELD